MKVLELFSGIGGMHFALNESQTVGETITAIDINTTANIVYKHNFPNTDCLSRNIQSLTAEFINKLDVDTILMSPPCQPFTRNGLKKDTEDNRSNAFLHLLNILPELKIENILIENVKGFEISEMRELLIEALEKSQYTYQEFILSPHQFGISNTRHRYYCLAKKQPQKFCFEVGAIMDNIKLFGSQEGTFPMLDILETNSDTSDYLVPINILRKYVKVLDICYPESTRSCCFTKAYGRFIEGSGSILTDKTEKVFSDMYDYVEKLDQESEEYVEHLQKLNLRFFTPTEISRLMSFPQYFSFPDNVTKKQRYMLLGNSINVKVVAELIKILKKFLVF